MKTTAKSTIDTLAKVALKEGSNIMTVLDRMEKEGTKTPKTYVADFKGISYIVDEAKDKALNSLTGEEVNLATFLYMLRREMSKDTTFKGNPTLLTADELTPIIQEIQSSDYVKEDVARDTETKDGSTISRTFTAIYWEANLLVIENTATCNGADMLHFREPSIKMYDTLSNAHLYYTDDVSSVLNFLGFERLDGYTWYNQQTEVIAHTGEYNFFKQGKGRTAVNTKKAKVDSLIAML